MTIYGKKHDHNRAPTYADTAADSRHLTLATTKGATIWDSQS